MYLVLNLGLKSIRAIVFDERGRIVANNSRPLSTILNGPHVEQSGEEWWEKGLEVMRASLQNSSVRRQIQYLTVTASSCCLVPVDEQGLPLSNVIMVSDKRAQAETETISGLASYQALAAEQPGLKVQSSLMLPKILWLKNNEPEVFDAAHYFLGPNDYLLHRLTGAAAVDVLNAEKCFYDTGRGAYPGELLAELSIPADKLPEVVNVGSIIGEVTAEARALLGIKPSQSVKAIATTYDAICAFYGSGACEEGDSCDVSGTVTSLRTLCKGKVELDTSAIFSQYQPDFDVSIVGGSNNLGGGLIEWAKQAFYSDEGSPYEVMESEARDIDCGADGVIFLPYLLGERAPLWNDEARAVFFGLARNHNRKHIIRAVFESAGFSLRSLSEEIEAAGRRVGSVRFSGGLSRIHLIAQIKADVIGKEIHIVDEFETTSMGAFLLMAIAVGVYGNLADAAGIVQVREVIFPNQSRHALYSEIYTLYKDIYQSLLGCYSRHAALHKDDIYRAYEKIENM